jgi:quercetin dioxygenase-like cupin family protein
MVLLCFLTLPALKRGWTGETPVLRFTIRSIHNNVERVDDHPMTTAILNQNRYANSPPVVKLAETKISKINPRIRFGAGGGVYRIVTTAKESGGQIFSFEASEPPGGGPPLHTHAFEDEYFFVLEGELTFYIDGHVIVAQAGESAFVPRGVVHCFKNCSDRNARVLVLFTPGKIEPVFDFGLPVDGDVPSDEHLYNRLSELGAQHGLTVLGPSPL